MVFTFTPCPFNLLLKSVKLVLVKTPLFAALALGKFRVTAFVPLPTILGEVPEEPNVRLCTTAPVLPFTLETPPLTGVSHVANPLASEVRILPIPGLPPAI